MCLITSSQYKRHKPVRTALMRLMANGDSVCVPMWMRWHGYLRMNSSCCERKTEKIAVICESLTQALHDFAQ